MKLLFSLLFLATFSIQAIAKEGNYTSPLSAYSAEWNDPKYQACNTAEHTHYLSAIEKEIVYVLNLARMNPQLFCKSVLPKAHDISSFIDMTSEVYYKSLVAQMSKMEPLNILVPDSLCYVSAMCHASTSGRKGYVGHDRQSADCRKKQHFFGECCQYGISDALGIVLTLLVDQNVANFGHREICLGKYTKMSPSYQPHKTYGSVTVMDFY